MQGLEIIIGDPSDPGGGAQVDMSKVVFDTNGGLVELPLLSGGRMYSPENPPTITVKGLGKNARVSAKFADEKPVERVAKFIITQVGPNGEPLNFACIDRGVYKEFPSDLDSGLPLEYDIQRQTPSDKQNDVLGTPGYEAGTGTCLLYTSPSPRD